MLAMTDLSDLFYVARAYPKEEDLGKDTDHYIAIIHPIQWTKKNPEFSKVQFLFYVFAMTLAYWLTLLQK